MTAYNVQTYRDVYGIVPAEEARKLSEERRLQLSGSIRLVSNMVKKACNIGATEVSSRTHGLDLNDLTEIRKVFEAFGYTVKHLGTSICVSW